MTVSYASPASVGALWVDRFEAVWDVGCGVWGFGGWGVRCEVWGVGCGEWDFGCGVWGVVRRLLRGVGFGGTGVPRS